MYRGRVQLGQWLTLGVQCTDGDGLPVLPTLPPDLRIYNGSGATVLGQTTNGGGQTIDTIRVPILDRQNTTGLFQGDFRITSDFAAGPYIAVYEWTTSSRTITDAEDSDPGDITITTFAAHGLSSSQQVTISGVLGNTAANGTFVIQETPTPTTFVILGTSNGAYTSGGVIALTGDSALLRHIDRFDVIAGGDGAGAFLSLTFIPRGYVNWLVGNTDSGARIAFRNPGVG
jgi:hypothetical protein